MDHLSDTVEVRTKQPCQHPAAQPTHTIFGNHRYVHLTACRAAGLYSLPQRVNLYIATPIRYLFCSDHNSKVCARVRARACNLITRTSGQAPLAVCAPPRACAWQVNEAVAKYTAGGSSVRALL